MYHATFVTQLPLEEVKRKLAPPYSTLPGWIEDETANPLRVTMYALDDSVIGLLFPDAIIQAADEHEGNSFVVNDDNMPLPAWFSTEGYKIVKTRTLQTTLTRAKEVNIYHVIPLNEVRI